ncbi:MAG: Spx/MgsR family RNA polymerase-binding regulatory protein [Bacilli bacterium]|nr:Spx/MgsR family RNA polymerase-binding regulatory protein [Bacilli bacterium]
MLKVYISPSCQSCRKVREFFKRRKIPFQEINIFKDLNYGDLLYLLTKSDNGTDDIISLRSKIVKEQKIDFNKMKLSETINFILHNPSVLKRPIIVNSQEMQVGYNAYDITSFIPRARELAKAKCNQSDCPTFKTCEHNTDYLRK